MIPETEIAKMKERAEKAEAFVWNGQHFSMGREEDARNFMSHAIEDIPNLIKERSELLLKIEAQERRLREDSEWTPVGNAWPPEKHMVIVAVIFKGEASTMTAYRLGDEWVNDSEDGRWYLAEYQMEVTHWMRAKQLPPPPRPFTSQEVFEGIPELVAKAEEMEKQDVPVVDVKKVGE